MPILNHRRSAGDGHSRWSLMPASLLALTLLLWTAWPSASTFARGQEQSPPAAVDVQVADSQKPQPAKPSTREDAVRALVAHLGLGKGSTIADIGAGRGQETWVFADVVGEKGAVYAEEIGEAQVKSLKEEAEKRNLSQVHALLGRGDDPCLPPDSVDLAFMRLVYHHFAKPREMLQGLRRGLKPGGYLVVVDQRQGTLRDWVPREQRQSKHFLIAETTVVREAREEGFLFVECAEECWFEEKADPFVLVFQRPEEPEEPAGDPDRFLPLEAKQAAGPLLPLGRPYQRPVFIALGEGRKLIEPILQGSSAEALEIVLEEWATQKDERPPLPENVSFPSVLTEQGDPQWDGEPIDVVFFLDGYHLLFHGKTLLTKIHEKLSPAGCVYVVDRRATEPLSRREASHRRQIDPQVVKQEMAEAGFCLWSEGPQPSPDRFLLVFGKTDPAELAPQADPFVGGPEVSQSPETWLKENGWRLRGLKTVDGRHVSLKGRGRPFSVKAVPAGSGDIEKYKLPGEGLLLTFEKKDGRYLLTESQQIESSRQP